MKRATAVLLSLSLALAALAGDAEDVLHPPKTPRPGEEWVPTGAKEPPPRATAPDDDALDLRGVLHLHTKHSHDSKSEPAHLVETADALGLDFVFVTDHPSPRSVADGLRGRHGRAVYFTGAETGGVLALDLKEEPKGDPRQKIAETRAQGGVAFLAHPEEWTDWDAPGWTGMEIVNLHHLALKTGSLGDALKGEKGKKASPEDKLARILASLSDPAGKRLFDAIGKLKDEPEGVLLAVLDRPREYLELWDRATRSRKAVGIAANDAHENVELSGVKVDPYARSLRVVSTHLFARSTGEKDIRAALEAGRAYVAFEVFGDPRGFSFFARDPSSGATAARMGEERAFERGIALELVARTPRAATIRILKDGHEVARADGATEARATAEGPGVYRVEVSVERRGREVPWILSNPIYLREDRT